MKELVDQYKPQIDPLQRDLSLVVLSHVAHRNLNQLDPNPSSLLNNIFGPAVEIEFPDEETASKIVVGLVTSTLDAFWGKNYPKNAKEQQVINNILLLKRQGLTKEKIVERLSLHFFWGANPQKI